MKKPVPNLNESPFGFDEFFFSTTNKRGVIRFGNDVFIRVSDYPKEQMLGAPHSLIRHPDMPRAVFKLFWDMLKSDKAIGAYVKNLAGNGSYYWVFAFAFPIEDGYLSIRFKPSSAIFQIVQTIYAEVRSFEQENESVEDSERLLLEKIKQHGFKDYEEFMVKATLAELNSRVLQVNKKIGQNELIQGSGQLQQIAETTNSTLSRLNDIFEKVSGFQKSNNVLVETMDCLDKEFLNLKFISVNMTIAAAKFGNVASSLGVVSKEFSALSGQIESNLSGLTSFVQNLVGVIQQCSFRASALNSQMLMVDFFVKESILKMQKSENAFSEMASNQKDFSGLFKDYSIGLQTEVSLLTKYLVEIETAMRDVSKFITGLEVIKQIGAVESARVDEVKQAFIHYLEQMDRFIQLLRNATTSITRETQSLEANSLLIASTVELVSGSVNAIFELAAKFGESNNDTLAA
ncbi:MAG: PAS domain-containing protein [Bacillota bacterium]